MQAVRAPGLDVNVFGVAFPNGGGPIVGFQDVAEIVVIDREEPRVGGVIAVTPFLRERRVREADAVPAPAVGLKHAARRRGRDEGEVVRSRLRPGIVEPIEAAAHIRESENVPIRRWLTRSRFSVASVAFFGASSEPSLNSNRPACRLCDSLSPKW